MGELGNVQPRRRIGEVECSAPLHGSGAGGTELHPDIHEIRSKSSSQRRPGHSASAEVSDGEGTWNEEAGETGGVGTLKGGSIRL